MRALDRGGPERPPRSLLQVKVIGKEKTVMPTQKVLKIREVATILSVSSRHVQRMVYQGKLPAIHLGPQTIRIPVREFEEWLDHKTDEAVTTQKRRRHPI